jgi:hypothetical protein
MVYDPPEFAFVIVTEVTTEYCDGNPINKPTPPDPSCPNEE